MWHSEHRRKNKRKSWIDRPWFRTLDWAIIRHMAQFEGDGTVPKDTKQLIPFGREHKEDELVVKIGEQNYFSHIWESCYPVIIHICCCLHHFYTQFVCMCVVSVLTLSQDWSATDTCIIICHEISHAVCTTFRLNSALRRAHNWSALVTMMTRNICCWWYEIIDEQEAKLSLG